MARRKQYLEYVWLDNTTGPEGKMLRSKTKIVDTDEDFQHFFQKGIEKYPIWSFDGSSTGQAETHDSELFLKPVSKYLDPFRKSELGIVVLCEVYDENGPHKSNTRHKMVSVSDKLDPMQLTWYGYEQEYFLMDLFDNRPYGAINLDEIKQGPYYCSSGHNISGREIAEKHLAACLYMRLNVSGTNSEVMYGQWEYQIGPVTAVSGADELWISRWVMTRVCEDYNCKFSLHPKPFNSTEYNGSGMHVNFSIADMRHPSSIQKKKAVEHVINCLERTHEKHIEVYGYGNAERLTGHNETCDIKTFKSGIGNRGASIRIPKNAFDDGANTYIEDRRPGSNADPYEIVEALLTSVFA